MTLKIHDFGPKELIEEILSHIIETSNDGPVIVNLTVGQLKSGLILALTALDAEQKEKEKLEAAFAILRPYREGGNLEAIKSSIKFIEINFTTHDTEDVSSCTRCNIVSLARWMSDIIKVLNGKGGEGSNGTPD